MTHDENWPTPPLMDNGSRKNFLSKKFLDLTSSSLLMLHLESETCLTLTFLDFVVHITQNYNLSTASVTFAPIELVRARFDLL